MAGLIEDYRHLPTFFNHLGLESLLLVRGRLVQSDSNLSPFEMSGMGGSLGLGCSSSPNIAARMVVDPISPIVKMVD